MRHLTVVFRSTGLRKAAKRTPSSINAPSAVCCGCGKPFPVREGRREAQVGQDGRLYCYDMTRECAVRAVNPGALKRAS